MKADFLEPLTSEIKHRNFAVFDIESKADDTQKAGFTRPFAVGFYDGVEYSCFRNEPGLEKLPWQDRACAPGGCLDKFLRHLLGFTDDPARRADRDRYRDFDVYAHNMGAFDGLFLPNWIQRNHHRYSYKIMPMQSRIQTIEIWRFCANRNRHTQRDIKRADSKDRKASGVWRFLDSFRIMPISLDAMAKSFGLEGKLKHDLNLNENDPHWDDYLRQDCEQLYLCMQAYQRLIVEMGGEVGITAPSTAMKILRRRYLNQGLKIHRHVHFPTCPIKHPDGTTCAGCAQEYFRTAYFGGRTEIYQRRGKGKYYDVNSSYPFSMKKPMPVGEMTILGENQDFSHLVETHIGFVRCTVEIPDHVYLPPLPVQHEGKLKFPVGTFSGTWDWVELSTLGRVGGRILHVEKSVWIKGERFLAQYVDDLYQMRNKKRPDYDEGKAATAKIMLNSTFGKFGMERERTEIVIVKPGEPEPFGGRLPGESVARWEKRKAQEKTEGAAWRLPEMPGPSWMAHDSPVRIRDVTIDAAYIIPQIAAHITALSRNLLWESSMEMLRQGYEIYYSDTDSIITNCDTIPDSTELGGLKREYNGETVEIVCYAPKVYQVTKETPFPKEHEKDVEDKRRCLETCPGCKLDAKGKPIKGEHATDEDGRRLCLEKCPGCNRTKIMMKGVPKEQRTLNTVRKLEGGDAINYQLLEKLGQLLRDGLRFTPRTREITKTMKMLYDKRVYLPNGDTRPIKVSGDAHLSPAYLQARPKLGSPPSWLGAILKRT